jgi:hypothetical protein
MTSGVYFRTEYHRKRNGEGHKGKAPSKETREKISKALMGHTSFERTLAYREKISKTMTGNPKITRENGSNWKGGFNKDGGGYALFNPPKGCRFSKMREKSGYIKLHRLIMAAFLQRPLNSEEVVHHINGIKKDNRIENLMLLKNKGEHVGLHNRLRIKKVKELKGGK